MSNESHTGDFLATKIKEVLESVGYHKFLAIVGDNGSNVKLAREKIVKMYPHLLDVQCIAHAINLIAQDILTIEFAD